MTHRLSTWLLVGSQIALIVPFQASAAAGPTPQQALNKALANYGTHAPLRSDMTLTFNVSERDYKTRAIKRTGQGSFYMRERHLSKTNETANAEGVIKINDLSSGKGVAQARITSPIVIEWKAVDKTLYMRLTQAPENVLKGIMLNNSSDPSILLNQWILVYDSKDASRSSIQIGDGTVKSLIGTSGFWNAASKRPLLTVVRVEKREKRTDGHEMLRMRVKVNPTLVNLWYASQLRQIKPNDPARRTKISALNKQITSVRKTLAKLSMVAIVDSTVGTLERFEAGIKQVDPVKSCTWNSRLRRSVCRATGAKTTTAALGISFLPDSGAPIEVPYGSLTMEELLKKMEPPKPEPLPAPAATSTTN